MQFTKLSRESTGFRSAQCHVENGTFSGGFPLRFNRPASLTHQQVPWYRSLDGYRYEAIGQQTKTVLAPVHRPAIHACLSYGLEQGDIQPSELAALCQDGSVNDDVALALASKVMGGLGKRLQHYRTELTDRLTALSVSRGSLTEKKELDDNLEWHEQHWLPTLSLSYVDQSGGDFGENGETMALRICRDHFMAYMSFSVWTAPEPLRPLLILALHAFSSLAAKPIALQELEAEYMWEGLDESEPAYNLLCDEIPYLLALEASDNNGTLAPQAVAEFLREQAPSLYEEMLDSIYGEEVDIEIWNFIKYHHRASLFKEICTGIDAPTALNKLQHTLLQWADLQNPILGHPICQRLAFLCELYSQQSFVNVKVEDPTNHEFHGDAPFNWTAMICTGDDTEENYVQMTAEGVMGGEYSLEVMGLDFTPSLEPYLQQMLFGDMALICLEGSWV